MSHSVRPSVVIVQYQTPSASCFTPITGASAPGRPSLPGLPSDPGLPSAPSRPLRIVAVVLSEK